MTKVGWFWAFFMEKREGKRVFWGQKKEKGTHHCL